MWYRFVEETNEWNKGMNIHLPNDILLNSDNKDEMIDGWKWYDEPPQDFLDWEEARELEDMRMMLKLDRDVE